jgi:hypothetical protein
MKRKLLLAFASAALLVGAANAQVVVRIGPPRPIVETRGVAPGPGYVWTPGYHRWDGTRYVWAPGAYVLPPRPHAVWVPHRWVRRDGGWYLAEGHWR